MSSIGIIIKTIQREFGGCHDDFAQCGYFPHYGQCCRYHRDADHLHNTCCYFQVLTMRVATKKPAGFISAGLSHSKY